MLNYFRKKRQSDNSLKVNMDSTNEIFIHSYQYKRKKKKRKGKR